MPRRRQPAPHRQRCHVVLLGEVRNDEPRRAVRRDHVTCVVEDCLLCRRQALLGPSTEFWKVCHTVTVLDTYHPRPESELPLSVVYADIRHVVCARTLFRKRGPAAPDGVAVRAAGEGQSPPVADVLGWRRRPSLESASGSRPGLLGKRVSKAALPLPLHRAPVESLGRASLARSRGLLEPWHAKRRRDCPGYLRSGELFL